MESMLSAGIASWNFLPTFSFKTVYRSIAFGPLLVQEGISRIGYAENRKPIFTATNWELLLFESAACVLFYWKHEHGKDGVVDWGDYA